MSTRRELIYRSRTAAESRLFVEAMAQLLASPREPMKLVDDEEPGGDE